MTTTKNINGITIELNIYRALLRVPSGRIVAKAEGCWDSQTQAESALQEEVESRASDAGMEIDEWLREERGATTAFEVTRNRADRASGRGLLHDFAQTLADGEQFDWQALTAHFAQLDKEESEAV